MCFVHFDFEMCFAPQRRALFRHLNFQKWSELGVLCILTWKCASRHDGVHFFEISTSKSGPRMVCFVHFDLGMCFGHNGVQFFISHLASWLRTRRFSEPTFRPSGATNHWKNRVIARLSYLFAHLHLLSSDSFSSTLLSSNRSLLSASALLCFSSVHIVGSLTSKLPSNIYNNIYLCHFVQKKLRMRILRCTQALPILSFVWFSAPGPISNPLLYKSINESSYILPFINLFTCFHIYLLISLFVYLSIHAFISLSILYIFF